MLPRVILYSAVSLDARLDWFTPDVGLYYELAGHWREDATLVGSDTLLAAPDDIPQDTGTDIEPIATETGDTRPLLVVPDSRGRIKTWHYWRRQPYWRDAVVLCSDTTSLDYLAYVRESSVSPVVCGRDHVDLRSALELLYERWNVRTIRVDSGGILNGILLRAGLIHEVSLLIHPVLVGGVSARSFFNADDLKSQDGIISLRLIDSTVVRDDILWLRYEPAI